MPEQGYLVAKAVTSNARIPVEDVTITVTQRLPDGRYELLAVWITDESGKTPSIAIPTPDLSISQAPSQKRPFSLVYLMAEHALYERIAVRAVQIFSGIVSIQELQLIPLDEFPELQDQTEFFEIPPQQL